MSLFNYNRDFKISRIQSLTPLAWGIEVVSGFASFPHGFRISRYRGIITLNFKISSLIPLLLKNISQVMVRDYNVPTLSRCSLIIPGNTTIPQDTQGYLKDTLRDTYRSWQDTFFDEFYYLWSILMFIFIDNQKYWACSVSVGIALRIYPVKSKIRKIHPR